MVDTVNCFKLSNQIIITKVSAEVTFCIVNIIYLVLTKFRLSPFSVSYRRARMILVDIPLLSLFKTCISIGLNNLP